MLWCRRGVLLFLCVCPLAPLMASPCPPSCCCPHGGVLVLCESLGLRSLPRSVPLSTSALSVARNQLCNVDHLLLAFAGLQELSLSHNLLARVPRGLPPSLESLHLQQNRITYITSGSLRHLKNLTRLDLKDNRIRAIQPGALEGLHKLQVLTLRGNELTNLPPKLPPSLTDLDLSANCVSVLDLPSLSPLVNLQVLKINSSCLRSVAEKAFDSQPELRSLDLTNNLWVCQCDILYLYRWQLSGGRRTATDVMCTEHGHRAHRLLLNLSVVALCPHVLKPSEKTHQLDLNSTVETRAPSKFGTWLKQLSQDHRDPPSARLLLKQYSLETLTYDECLSLNKTLSASANPLKGTTSSPDVQQKSRENVTGHYPQINATSAEGTRPLLSTNRDAPRLTPNPQPHTQASAAVVSLLALLCVLVALLTLAVLLVLKKVIVRQQRVAPLDVGSGGRQQTH